MHDRWLCTGFFPRSAGQILCDTGVVLLYSEIRGYSLSAIVAPAAEVPTTVHLKKHAVVRRVAKLWRQRWWIL